jgi:outer membrane receptor protein involved in Fe transport
VDPEHGMNYDLIVNRRIWRDIQLKVDYSYYKIKDYVANNWDYADYYYTDPTAPAGLEGSDMYINLDEVIRHGLEVEINGNLIDSLSFYISYAYQEYDYDGTEPAGMELGDVAKHRVNAGLRYRPSDKTLVMLDYKYQDDQIAHEITESPAGSGNYVSYDNPMSAYNVFDLGINQTLFNGQRLVKDLSVGFYVNNLFNEKYENSQGYPMTEQSFTAKLSFRY